MTKSSTSGPAPAARVAHESGRERSRGERAPVRLAPVDAGAANAGVDIPEIEPFLGPAPDTASTNETLFRLVTRTTDICVSLSVLVFSLPIMVLVALAIKLDSPGPVFFRGRRAMLNRRRPRSGDWDGPERRSERAYAKEFWVYKFRTMRGDAAERFPELYAYEHTPEQLRTLPMKMLKAAASGPGAEGQTSIPDEDDDPRLTRFGRWLRRTSIDEIPNLINVLRGEMSLVGGRPEEPAFIRHYIPEHRRKFDMKPGVTGLAQVMGRGNLTFHEINAYDSEYVDHHSVKLYFWILWRTVRVVVTGEGAY